MYTRRPSAPLLSLALGMTLALALPRDAHAQQGETRLLFGTQEQIPFAELLDLLDLLPGINTKVTVAASPTGARSDSVTFANGRLGCHVTGDNLILEAFAGPGATGTCYARACTTTLGLVTLCADTAYPLRSVACIANTDAVDAGCTAAAPACDESGEPTCVGCTEDAHCGAPDLITLVAGQTVTVADDLLRRLLGVDLTAVLTDVQVRADASAPWSDEAIAGADLACMVGPDGRVQVAAGADAEATGACQVRACVALLGLCVETELDLLVDACVLSGTCDPVAVCDTATKTCLECRDDRAPGLIDSGCASATPACSDATCVQCVADEDCQASLLPIALAPGQGLTVGLADILEVLQLTPTLLPSDVSVGADVNGPFGDEALLGADAQIARCAVTANGDVEVLSVGAEGQVTCYVEVCADLLGTVTTCLVAPIDIDIDACVLSGTCNLEPVCLDDHTCAECRDSEAPGRVDRGCGDATPACDGGACVECLEDLDCTPRHPLVDLDVGDTGLVPREDILAALDLDVNALVDELSVAATADGPFADTALLDLDADVARCSVDVDGDVLLLATTEVYGEVTCYVRACVNVLAADTCLVVPVTLNVDPCASAGTCRPPICSAEQTCEVCRDAGPGVVDPGCAPSVPACLTGVEDSRCVECTVDADCAGDLVCDPTSNTCVECLDDTQCPGGACDLTSNTCVECLDDTQCPGGACDLSSNTCVICRDDTVGDVDSGCEPALQACLDLDGNDTDHCVQCTVDADCDGNLVCDTTSNTCVECLDDTQCPGGACDLTSNTCVICRDDTVGDVDSGCEPALQACLDLDGNDTDHCVECTVDADCDGNLVCDPTSNTCVECLDDTQCPGGACDLSSNTCVICRDDTVGDVDSGCEPALQACLDLDGNDTDHCVECTVDADCDGNLVCDPTANTCVECLDDTQCPGGACDLSSNTCVICRDDTVGDVDSGCEPALQACLDLDGNDNDRCVQCTVDADCDGNLVCDTTSNTCVECLDDTQCPGGACDLSSNTCVICRDDTVGDVDSGCEPALQACLDLDGNDTDRCVQCTVDADCDGNLVCDPTSNTCVECLDDTQCPGGACDLTSNTCVICRDDTVGDVDSGCEPALQACLDLDGNDTDHCVQCTVDADCDGNLVCDTTSNTCVECLDDTQCPGGACDLSSNTCVICRDDTVGDVDSGCEPALQACLDLDGNDNDRCVQCTVDADCDGNLVCDTTSNTCVECLDDTQCPGGACDLSSNTCAQPNRAPSAIDDLETTPEDTAVLIAVLENDLDADGDDLTLTAIDTPPTRGIAELVDQQVRYTPAPDQSGVEAFTYRVCDPDGACDIALVEVTVTPVNDAPRAFDDDVETTIEIDIDVLANDLDPDGDPLSLGALELTSGQGTFDVVDGQVHYTPPTSWTGTATARYEACDPSDACESAVVTVHVGTTSPALPVVLDDEASTLEGVAVNIDVLANDTAPEGTTLTLSAWTQGDQGSVSHVDGGLTYTPGPGFVGADTFGYVACTADGRCAQGRVTVEVTPGAPEPPAARDDTYTLLRDTELDFDPTLNDSDPDGDTLVIADFTQPTHGTVTRVDLTTLTYTPAPGFVGEDLIEVTVADADGLTAVELVVFQVLERDNTSPIARDDAATAAPGVEVAVDVLGNDEDPDGDPLTITAVVLPEHVSARFDPSIVGGPIFVTLDADFSGEASLGYRITDGRGGFATARVTVRTPTPNEGPSVVDDAASTPEDTTVSVDVLMNDEDPDGDELTVTLATPPSHGTAVIEEGLVTYTPAPDFHGTDTFTYRACDPAGACGEATVTLMVTPVADAPRAEDDRATVSAGLSTTLDVLANDVDPDGDQLVIDNVTAPATGTLRLVDGALVYDAPTGFEGEVTATYEACDPGGLCDSATLIVTVSRAPIGGPVPTDDEAWTDRDAETMIDVLANDTHPEGATLVVRSLVQPGRGEAWPERGMVGYRPPEGWLGDDVLWYEVCDPALRCAMGMVAVHVVEPTPNATPVATDDSVVLAPGESLAVEVLANDHDPDGDALSLTEIGTSRLATLTVTGDNRVLVLADGPEIGEEDVDYIVCDARGACSTAVLHIAVRVPGETPEYMVTGGPSCQGGGGGASLLGIALLILLARARRRTI